ncbi:MAG: preprotein translocase subunit SecG [Endomicrobium sp.]|jgi:preprotein translocase subunit SecG|nr:preprotein translocase subunit SecG [Endomicrobium sp.]
MLQSQAKVMNSIFFLFILKVIHCIVSGGLILLVLFHIGKSRGMIGIFGGYDSEQIFNIPSKMAFVKKLVVVLACLFLVSSLVLTKLSKTVNWVSVCQ